MKKYRKPILDIVEFDNLDVMITSDEKQGDEDSGSNSAIQPDNELSLNQVEVEISPIPVGVTETPAPADPLEPTPADDDDELAAQTVPEDEVE